MSERMRCRSLRSWAAPGPLPLRLATGTHAQRLPDLSTYSSSVMAQDGVLPIVLVVVGQQLKADVQAEPLLHPLRQIRHLDDGRRPSVLQAADAHPTVVSIKLAIPLFFIEMPRDRPKYLELLIGSLAHKHGRGRCLRHGDPPSFKRC